ncbi:PREDICTED: UPF0481 protein At3g47200-like [Prunus mume]|uniref:UPF0481 protein At3g47200-like n=1 Tax=Prunus mume TaxID=102107 RepID=A0ABM0PK55_PRUMU|nr:PREDICTED: UPF0481 protein At3g47200-like [Prunus mume]
MAQTNENVVSTEKELFVKQVTRRGGGQVSRGEIEQTSKASITIHEEAIKTSPKEERLEKLRKAPAEAAAAAAAGNSTTQGAKPKIQRVPFMLRDNKKNDKYYEPRVAAIGPFHHGIKPKYQQAEKIKLQLAGNFVLDSKQNDADLLKKVEEKIKDLRECYDEEATKDFDDDSLAWMLFVDGCSTLEFIYKYDDLECFGIKRDQVAFAEQDMFLLENQLPYQLLKLLMSSSSIHEDLKDSIEKFVQMHGGDQKQEPQPMEPEPTHLLEHLLTRMLGYPPKKSETSASAQPGAGVAQNTQRHDEPEKTHLLGRLLTRMLRYLPKKSETSASAQPGAGGAKNTQQHVVVSMEPEQTHLPKKKSETSAQPEQTHRPKKNGKSSAQSFRNVQELHSAGIYFWQKKGPTALSDIKFKSILCCGFLYLPKIKVDDSMGPKFMNLIAYEMCPDFQNDFGVTSYIGFLDSLIDHPDDVKHLRKKHILRNFLGSDDEVAQLFNEIGTDLVPNNAIYSDVKSKIEDHYKTNWKKWMAQFFHEHFSSPWTILAFIGVLLGLGMTAAQTWYAANSGTAPCEALLEYLKARGY